MIGKLPSGIPGLDAVLAGGLPRARATLIEGGTGSGKSVIAVALLVAAARRGEPGVFVSFERSPEATREDASGFGWDVSALEAADRLRILHFDTGPRRILREGVVDLSATRTSLIEAMDQIDAKLIALDAPSALGEALVSPRLLGDEIRWMLGEMTGRGATVLATRTDRRQGGVFPDTARQFDCIIRLEQYLARGRTARRLHVTKYCGSGHALDEIPFVIDARGPVVGEAE